MAGSYLFDALSNHVNNVVEANRGVIDSSQPAAFPGTPMGEFACTAEPPCSIGYYMSCLRGLCLETEWVHAVILVDRLTRKAGHFVSPLTAHRLILAAVSLSVKMNRDVRLVHKFFKKHTGESIKDLNGMESAFLYLLDWDLHVTREEFDEFVSVIPRLAEDGNHSGT
eukprot:Hpha_TRINITY_DN16623_c5_g2::TRINITY_DN16623_c5_g2_i3::g.181037::m.181037